LLMKEVTPVRLLKNKFFDDVLTAEKRGASKEDLIQLLGKRRAKAGMFEGDMIEGELEIGQVAAGIKSIQSAKTIVDKIWNEYLTAKKELLKD